MASQKLLAFAFALVVAVQADNCNKVSKGTHQLISSALATTYCSSASLSCTTDKCDCAGTCCERADGTCTKLSKTVQCGTGKVEDTSKKAVKATPSTYITACCINKKTCDVTCPAGYKNKANYGSAECSSDTCGTSECCDSDPSKCMGATGSCGADKIKDPSKVGNTFTTFATDCCMTTPTYPTCGDSPSCDAGYIADGATSNSKCYSGTCSSSDCCKPDPSKCAGVTGTACAAGSFQDSTKAGIVATAANYNANCCTAKATCKAFSEAVIQEEGTASSAKKQEAPTLVFFVALVGIVVFDK